MNKKMGIAIAIVAIIIVAAVAAVALTSTSKAKTTIKESGSDTMLELMTNMAEQFNKNSSTTSVTVSGGGSGVGIQAFIDKKVDIAQASRPMTSDEINKSKAAGLNPVEFKVAIDGVAIIVNNANTVTNLTLAQLQGLYNGTYTNWNQVGGADMPITVYGRQSSSGTYAYFQEVVLKKGNYTANMQQLTGNSAIVSAVGQTQGGIGYVGVGYAKENTATVKAAVLQKDAASPGISPLNSAAVIDQTYPLSRYLFVYTNGAPTWSVKEWVSFILDSNGGQKIAADIGFYALPPDVQAAMKAQLG